MYNLLNKYFNLLKKFEIKFDKKLLNDLFIKKKKKIFYSK